MAPARLVMGPRHVGVDLPQPEMVPPTAHPGVKGTLFPKSLKPRPGQDLRGNPLNPPPQGREAPLGAPPKAAPGGVKGISP